MILTYNFSLFNASSIFTLNLPLIGIVTSVNWGDGTAITNTLTHTYNFSTASRNVIVTINGTFSAMSQYINNQTNSAVKY